MEQEGAKGEEPLNWAPPAKDGSTVTVAEDAVAVADSAEVAEGTGTVWGAAMTHI